MALLIIFTMVEEATAKVQRIFVDGRGHVRAAQRVVIVRGRPARVRRGSSAAALVAGITAGAVLGGLGRRRPVFVSPRRGGGGGTRIINIDRSTGKTINRGAQLDDATADEPDTSDDDDSDDDTDSGNDDADSDGDASGSDDGGDD
jgi:hypothetical protein